MSKILGFTAALLLVATATWAQDWRGNGRLSGKVLDEQGKPLQGVVVNASLPAYRGILARGKTDKKGEWTVDDVGEGNWELTFELPGYNQAKATADVDEDGRSAPLKVTLKKAFDPNAFIQEEVKKAKALVDEKKYADARAVYEGIVAKVPEVSPQLQQYIAQTYYLEGKADKAAEILRAAVAKDPTSVQAKLLLISMLLETGAIDEAGQMLGGIEESKISDAAVYSDFGLTLLKKQKYADALPYFEKATTKFPQAPESYYYRALALVQLVNEQKDAKDPQRIARIGQIKSDLSKYLQLAPTSPAADDARKLLEQVEKQVPK